MAEQAQPQPFQLDKKELLKDMPFALKALVGPAIDWVNKMDINHDGKADLSQLAPYAIKALPLIAVLAPLVQWDKFVDWFLAHDFIEDQEAARKMLEQLLGLAIDAANKVAK